MDKGLMLLKNICRWKSVVFYAPFFFIVAYKIGSYLSLLRSLTWHGLWKPSASSESKLRLHSLLPKNNIIMNEKCLAKHNFWPILLTVAVCLKKAPLWQKHCKRKSLTFMTLRILLLCIGSPRQVSKNYRNDKKNCWQLQIHTLPTIWILSKMLGQHVCPTTKVGAEGER